MCQPQLSVEESISVNRHFLLWWVKISDLRKEQVSLITLMIAPFHSDNKADEKHHILCMFPLKYTILKLSDLQLFSPCADAIPLPAPAVPNYWLPPSSCLSTLICQVGWINVNVFYEMLTHCQCCSSWLNIDIEASCFGGSLNSLISPDSGTCTSSHWPITSRPAIRSYLIYKYDLSWFGIPGLLLMFEYKSNQRVKVGSLAAKCCTVFIS